MNFSHKTNLLALFLASAFIYPAVADDASENIVHITKRNATGYAIDGGTGGENKQNVTLMTADTQSINQQWIEIDRGDGYYSYQKVDSDYCIDANEGAEKNQNVYLWQCIEDEYNQHWKKIDMANGGYQLLKRDVSYALNGGNAGADAQTVNLWSASSSSENLQWYITYLDTNDSENSSSSTPTASVFNFTVGPGDNVTLDNENGDINDTGNNNLWTAENSYDNTLIHSVTWSGDDLDGDGIQDILSFDIVIQGYSDSTYSYSETAYQSSMTSLGEEALASSNENAWSVDDNQYLDDGESISFNIDNLYTSASNITLEFNGFSAFTMSEPNAGFNHVIIIGEGTGLDGFSFNTPTKERSLENINELIVTSGGSNNQREAAISLLHFTISIANESDTDISIDSDADSDINTDTVNTNTNSDYWSFESEVDGDTAAFSLYIPTSVDKIVAAVYISLHGQGTITYSVLQEFAAAENLALVGFYGDGVQRGVDDVAILDEHIATLAIMSGHAELPDAPIMTFGHSNGSGFAASWPRDRPEQVISWVSFHPGFSAYLQYDNTDDVPSMVMCGESDSYFINSRQDEIVYDLRNTEDAVMNVMVEGDVSHGWGNKEESWTFITEFWKATMRIRLEDDGTLTDIDTTSGWLGSQYDVDEGQRQLLDIGAYADYDDDPSNANWLPDAEFAEMWQSYGNAPVGEWLDD